MKSRMLANGSCLPLKSARRNATVTISVPLAAIASRIASGDGNFPVPKTRRDWKLRPAIVNGWFSNRIAGSINGWNDLSRREGRRILTTREQGNEVDRHVLDRI